MDELKSLAASLHTRLGELTEAVRGLTDRLAKNETLAKSTQVLAQDTQSLAQSTKHRAKVLAVVVIVDVLLTGIVSYSVWAQYHQRVAVLCPLYSVIVGAYAPNTRAAGPDREAYIAGYHIINQAYQELSCPAPPLPPRAPGAAGQ